jgi:hypothetical protein
VVGIARKHGVECVFGDRRREFWAGMKEGIELQATDFNLNKYFDQVTFGNKEGEIEYQPARSRMNIFFGLKPNCTSGASKVRFDTSLRFDEEDAVWWVIASILEVLGYCEGLSDSDKTMIHEVEDILDEMIGGWQDVLLIRPLQRGHSLQRMYDM